MPFVVDFVRKSRLSTCDARESEARPSEARRSSIFTRKSVARRSEARRSEARKSIFGLARNSVSRPSAARKRGSLQDGTSVASWVQRMSVEEKAATIVAAVEGDAAADDESASVVRARQRLSIMSVAEQHEVLTEILDTTSARAPPSNKKTRQSLSGPAGVAGARASPAGLQAVALAAERCAVAHDEDGVVPFEASLGSSRWTSLVSVEEESEPAPAPRLETAARRSWKRCRNGVLAAGYWQRCAFAAVLERWKAALTAEQLVRLQRLYTLEVLSDRDSLARHQRYFKVADTAAVEVENMYRPRKLNPVGFRRADTKPKPSKGGGHGAPAATPAATTAKAKPARKRRSLIPNFRRSQVDPSGGRPEA